MVLSTALLKCSRRLEPLLMNHLKCEMHKDPRVSAGHHDHIVLQPKNVGTWACLGVPIAEESKESLSGDGRALSQGPGSPKGYRHVKHTEPDHR